jgi:hypothetical protein
MELAPIRPSHISRAYAALNMECITASGATFTNTRRKWHGAKITAASATANSLRSSLA